MKSADVLSKVGMPAVYIAIGGLAASLGFVVGAIKPSDTAQFWSAVSALGTITGSLITAVSVAVAALSLRSQARQNRISLATDMLMKLTDQFDGKRMQMTRSHAAEFLRTKSEQTNSSVDSILDFFEQVALLERRGAIDIEFVWHTFYNWLFHYYHLTQQYRAAARADDPTVWADLQGLYQRMLTEQQNANKDAGRTPTPYELHEFIESEICLLGKAT